MNLPLPDLGPGVGVKVPERLFLCRLYGVWFDALLRIKLLDIDGSRGCNPVWLLRLWLLRLHRLCRPLRLFWGRCLRLRSLPLLRWRTLRLQPWRMLRRGMLMAIVAMGLGLPWTAKRTGGRVAAALGTACADKPSGWVARWGTAGAKKSGGCAMAARRPATRWPSARRIFEMRAELGGYLQLLVQTVQEIHLHTLHYIRADGAGLIFLYALM